MIEVGTEVRRLKEDSERVGRIVETGMNDGKADYSRVHWLDDQEEARAWSYYDHDLEIINSTRSKIAMKLNLSGNVKEFLVRASYQNPAQGIRETKEFDNEAQAKDFAARSVVEGNKGAEAYIYRLERVARLPLPEVDWQGNPKS